MHGQWKLDDELKRKAKLFFELARGSVVTDSAQLPELFSRGDFKMLGGLMFSINKGTSHSQSELIARCVKLIGSKAAHEKEIENIAWDCVLKSLEGEAASSDIAEIITVFVKALHEHIQRQYQYVSPNYIIRFQGAVTKLHIGPVEALLTSEYLPKLFEINKALAWSLGSKFELTISVPGGVSFEFPPVIWRVSLQAAPGHIEEEATWLINIAISLLRLSYPTDKRYGLFPENGAREFHPINLTRMDKQGITFADSGISYGGTTVGRLYEIDSDVIASTEATVFIDRAKAIFTPTRKSLGERFGQGLGWLSRGRQSADRAEKFLFFFTAIEALLSSDDKTAPVVQTISRYVSVILQDDVKFRSQLAGRIKSLYAIRSGLVHAGTRNVSNSDVNIIQLVAESIYWVVMDRMELTTSFVVFHESLSEASYGLPWMQKSDELMG